jgi:hypothetical protein
VSSTSARSSATRASASAAFAASSSCRRRAAAARATRAAGRHGAPLLVADEGVEHVELVRRPREPPLLELPDIATSRSASAATSSRATLRPQAYARVRPSAKIRRASTSPSSSSGAAPRALELVQQPSGRSSSASTYASLAVRADRAASPFAPSSSPIAWRGSSCRRRSRR